MEILAYLGIQANTSVVVDGKLLFICVIRVDGHSPPVQEFVLAQVVVLLYQGDRIDFLLTSAPTKTS